MQISSTVRLMHGTVKEYGFRDNEFPRLMVTWIDAVDEDEKQRTTKQLKDEGKPQGPLIST